MYFIQFEKKIGGKFTPALLVRVSSWWVWESICTAEELPQAGCKLNA